MSSHGAATLPVEDIPAIEKPQNGIAGLKHFQYDLMAGLQVAMMGIPLSLGIAIASGAPPVCGLISAIIAGFVFPFPRCYIRVRWAKNTPAPSGTAISGRPGGSST